ncbi:MAG: bifunctional 5,10-methylenetetrahydrofolate dehydrogenase/5,10-methenyltetrahydrofolate cyclohydrolase [Clostridiales bacterium]|jgi:methylenetetrahydrofolate dehydrogenase (NADP+)/methenyltetrahydrofolate cyclohydrolase|nr:bifunctional 5,10-methylenetetrahydrofolate dehydrogenase/5,10-methenyltetrahydrofolate cyclohydrolase [Clostridiales bacterium]
MAKLLEGRPVAAALRERQRAAAAALAERGVRPVLEIIRVGSREDDMAYERSASRRCGEAGVDVRATALPEGASQGQLLERIGMANRDGSVHGVLLLRPLPAGMDDEAVRNALAPEKDVDGIGDAALARVFAGTGGGFAPCTAQACMELLDFYGYGQGLAGKRAAVIGRSLVVGRPVAMLLLARHATVTVCHTRTADMAAECRRADILIVAAGRAGVVGEGMFSPGQVVIDVGINFDEGGKMRGDADFGAAMPVVGAIAPVPGGVGGVTASVLAGNVIEAARRAAAGA